MDIEAQVYARLSTYTDLTALVADRIYPTVPTDNVPTLPFVVYTVTASEPNAHLEGVTNLERFTVDIATFALNLDTVLAVLSKTRAALHGYRGGNVQGSFLTTQATIQEDEGHHGSQSYAVWATV